MPSRDAQWLAAIGLSVDADVYLGSFQIHHDLCWGSQDNESFRTLAIFAIRLPTEGHCPGATKGDGRILQMKSMEVPKPSRKVR